MSACSICHGTLRVFFPGGVWRDCPACVEGKTVPYGGEDFAVSHDERPRADKSLDDYRVQLRAKRRRVKR